MVMPVTFAEGCITMREKILISKIVMLQLYMIFFNSYVYINHKYGQFVGRLIPGLEMKALSIRTWCSALALLRQLKVCNLHTLKCMSWVYLFWEIMPIWGFVVLERGWVYIWSILLIVSIERAWTLSICIILLDRTGIYVQLCLF